MYVSSEKVWFEPWAFRSLVNTLPLGHRANRSSHQQLFPLYLPGYLCNLYDLKYNIVN